MEPDKPSITGSAGKSVTLLSLAIIIYFLAGGEFADDVITLQIIDVRFERLWVLGTIFWVIFAFSAIQYFSKLEWKLCDHLTGQFIRFIRSRSGDRYREKFEQITSSKVKEHIVSFQDITDPGYVDQAWSAYVRCRIKMPNSANENNKRIEVVMNRTVGLDCKFLGWLMINDQRFFDVIVPGILFFAATGVTIQYLMTCLVLIII